MSCCVNQNKNYKKENKTKKVREKKLEISILLCLFYLSFLFWKICIKLELELEHEVKNIINLVTIFDDDNMLRRRIELVLIMSMYAKSV